MNDLVNVIERNAESLEDVCALVGFAQVVLCAFDDDFLAVDTSETVDASEELPFDDGDDGDDEIELELVDASESDDSGLEDEEPRIDLSQEVEEDAPGNEPSAPMPEGDPSAGICPLAVDISLSFYQGIV